MVQKENHIFLHRFIEQQRSAEHPLVPLRLSLAEATTLFLRLCSVELVTLDLSPDPDAQGVRRNCGLGMKLRRRGRVTRWFRHGVRGPHRTHSHTIHEDADLRSLGRLHPAASDGKVHPLVMRYQSVWRRADELLGRTRRLLGLGGIAGGRWRNRGEQADLRVLQDADLHEGVL